MRLSSAFIELSLVEALDGVAGDGIIVEQMLDYSALDEVLVNYLRNVLDLYLAVERAFGINNDYRTQGAQTEAARPDDLDFVCETFSAISFSNSAIISAL